MDAGLARNIFRDEAYSERYNAKQAQLLDVVTFVPRIAIAECAHTPRDASWCHSASAAEPHATISTLGQLDALLEEWGTAPP